METKVVVMPPPAKRRVRFRIGNTAYEVRVNVEIARVALPAPAPLNVMPAVFGALPEVEAGPVRSQVRPVVAYYR